MKNLSKNAGRVHQLQAVFCCVAISLALSMTGCSTAGSSGSGPEQTAGAKLDDHNTTVAVGSALTADPEYKFDTVNVETSAGTVQLSGFAMSDDQKNRAGIIAKNVTTVKSVVNNITVKPSLN